jgi:hypothetical protein
MILLPAVLAAAVAAQDAKPATGADGLKSYDWDGERWAMLGAAWRALRS